jgi:predicted Zn-dependent protease
MKNKLVILLCLLIFLALSCKKRSTGRSEMKVVPVNFLSSEKYKKLIIDIVHDKNFPPSKQTIERVKSFLGEIIHKPAGIEIHVKEINGTEKNFLSLGDITQVEEASRVHNTKGELITAFVYLANAEYTEKSNGYKTLGIQYGTNSIVLFGKTIREHSGGLNQPSYPLLETTIALHEFGHVLGLVNAGTEMITPHMDSAHGHHCANNNCLMYFATETTHIVKILTGGTVPNLDSQCLSDLKNNGGK